MLQSEKVSLWVKSNDRWNQLVTEPESGNQQFSVEYGKKSIKTEGTTHYVQSNQSWEEILPLVNWQRQILCLTDKIVIYNLILEGA